MSDEINLALISFDGVQLLLPQRDIATIDSSSGIETAASGDGTIGVLRTVSGEWPVYALAGDFSPRTDIPPTYKYCIAVDFNGAGFALACEQVGSIEISDQRQLQPLQACMRSADNPIESLLLKDGKLMLVSDAESMSQYLLPEAAA